MNEHPIPITLLNDFIFCPASIFFHLLYGETDKISVQRTDQINGSSVHETVDNGIYSSLSNILQGLSVYSDKYGLVGKIDLFDTKTGILTERKRSVKTIYDGYIFQLYGQYFALTEMGYVVREMYIYSYSDNKKYPVDMPHDNPTVLRKFEKTIREIKEFDLTLFMQDNPEKCRHCIYEPACDRGLC